MNRTNNIGVGGNQSASFSYYADVDGLRAVAIIAVILFHFGISGTPGGFTGVDVFFVISGFLVGGQIISRMKDRTFSLNGFWLGRARRILPLLLMVQVATLIAGWFLQLTVDYAALGKSVVSNSFFVSNFLFWYESGYFDAPAQTKPLLHTWSLAIEEQFYFVLPFILLLLAYFKKTERQKLLILIALAALSFAFCAWSTFRTPETAFYLLPSRFWELALGVLVAFISINKEHKDSEKSLVWELIAFTAILAIIWSVLCYNDSIAFPGFAALVPCLGAVAFIAANRYKPSVTGHLFSLAPIAWLGRLSYSLYLWHWPVLIFVRASQERSSLSTKDTWVAIFCIFIVAAISYYLVEKPIHKKRILSRDSHFMVFIITALMLTTGLAMFVYLSDGVPKRMLAQASRYASYAKDTNERYIECSKTSEQISKGDLCGLGHTKRDEAPSFIAFGDSHANAIMPLLDKMSAESNVPGRFAFHGGCPPLMGVYKANEQGKKDTCKKFNDAMFSELKKSGVKEVLLISRWSYYTLGGEGGNRLDDTLLSDAKKESHSISDSQQVFIRSLNNTINTLNDWGMKVWILEQAPYQSASVPQRLAWMVSKKKGDPTKFGVLLSEHKRQQAFVNDEFSRLAKADKIRILDLAPILCSDGNLCRAEKDGAALYMDRDHLSTTGSMELVPVFEDFFKQKQ